MPGPFGPSIVNNALYAYLIRMFSDQADPDKRLDRRALVAEGR